MLLFTLGWVGLVFCSSPLTLRTCAAAAERSTQERLDDLEACINNSARNPGTNAPSKQHFRGAPGRCSSMLAASRAP
jgi:hypothetical protein